MVPEQIIRELREFSRIPAEPKNNSRSSRMKPEEKAAMVDLILKDEVYAIVGAAMEVHREMGFGFSEPVYQECMELELQDRNISAVAQKEMSIAFKKRKLKKTCIADFIAFDQIVVELKALDKLTSREDAQVINYLKASGLEVGVLINFGGRSLEWKRLVKTDKVSPPVDLKK